MKISKEKRDKISEQVLAYLYSQNPKPIFTSHIAIELARDEEFIKKILLELKAKNLIIKIDKNPLGKTYSKRMRWKLSNKAYETYQSMQSKQNRQMQ